MMAHMHVEDDGSNSSVKLVHFKWSECSEELLGDLTDTLYRNYQSLPGLTTLYLHLCEWCWSRNSKKSNKLHIFRYFS